MQVQQTTTEPTHHQPPKAPKQLFSVKQLAESIPAYQGRTGSIRWQIFNSDTNGLKESGAIIRHGRRILIDVDKYFAWQESLAETQGVKA